MGMQVRIVLYAADKVGAATAATAAFAEIARLDAVLSNYRTDSEVSLLGRGSGPRSLGEDLFLVLDRALRLARETRGAFDPTAGAVTALWRRAIQTGLLPPPDQLRQAVQRSGYEKLAFDRDLRTAEVLEEGLALDLGGIAKGYVLDRAREVLHERGVDCLLIEAGGDIVIGSAPPGSRGWRVDVAHIGGGDARGSDRRCTLVLHDAAVSTSGDEVQFLEVQGRRYAHIVDPRTGVGLSEARTVTVVAPDGLTADSLATALAVVDDVEIDRLLGLYPVARRIASPEDCDA